MKIVAASLLALGMATSAFAQSNPAPTGATMDKNSSTGSGGGATSDTATPMKPMATDSSSTGSTTMGTTADKPCNGNDAASSTGNGSLQTQGGSSNATPQDTKCAAHSFIKAGLFCGTNQCNQG
jgi:hypothetical protein